MVSLSPQRFVLGKPGFRQPSISGEKICVVLGVYRLLFDCYSLSAIQQSSDLLGLYVVLGLVSNLKMVYQCPTFWLAWATLR